MLLSLLKQKKYSEMYSLYQASVMLSENHKQYDNFALGWGYSYMALAAFEQKQYKDGIIFLSDAITFFLDDLYILEAAYLSLYLYAYSVPSKYIKMFRKLEGSFSLITRLGVYVQKHVHIAEKYAKIFELSNSESKLQKFYDDIKDINDNNYNPDEIKLIMDSICLI
jgi:tetratricopeptide (TPR) repeat protein